MVATRSWGSGTAAVARLLFSDREPMPQRAVAELVDITQARVSQALRQLATAGVIERTGSIWKVTPAMPTVYARRFRPAISSTSYWFHLDTPMKQVRLLQEIAAPVVISADTAADLIAPWKRPTHTVAYVDDRDTVVERELDEFGFVPAESQGDASVILRATTDRRLLGDVRMIDGVRVVHRLQIYADLVALGGTDRLEAAERLLG